MTMTITVQWGRLNLRYVYKLILYIFSRFEMRSYCIRTRQLKWSFITLFVCTLADSIRVIAFSVHKPLHFKRYISPIRKFKLAQERHHFLFIIQVLNGWNGNFSKWEIDFFWHWNKQTAWIVSHQRCWW